MLNLSKAVFQFSQVMRERQTIPNFPSSHKVLLAQVIAFPNSVQRLSTLDFTAIFEPMYSFDLEH